MGVAAVLLSLVLGLCTAQSVRTVNGTLVLEIEGAQLTLAGNGARSTGASSPGSGLVYQTDLTTSLNATAATLNNQLTQLGSQLNNQVNGVSSTAARALDNVLLMQQTFIQMQATFLQMQAQVLSLNQTVERQPVPQLQVSLSQLNQSVVALSRTQQELMTRVATLEDRLNGLNTTVLTEATRAVSLNASILNETSRAVRTESSLGQQIATEVSRAVEAEGILFTLVNATNATVFSERSIRRDQVNQLTAALNTEVSTRLWADQSLAATAALLNQSLAGLALVGTSAVNAAPSASFIRTQNPNAQDGIYWLRFASGSNTPFQAYIIFSRPDGPFVKAVQWSNLVDVSGAATVNPTGTWLNAQVNLAAGKLASADIDAMRTAQGTSVSTLWRVTGGTDSLFNNGAGALKMVFTGASVPNWGTNRQPVAGQPYEAYLDMDNNGVYEYAYRYVPSAQGTCNHVTSVWLTDHASPPAAGSGVISPFPAAPTASLSTGWAICWTFGATSFYTNLHWMSGLPTVNSGGSVQWGTATTAATIYIRN